MDKSRKAPIRRALLRVASPFMLFLGRLALPSANAVSPDDVRVLLGSLEPGDVLLSRMRIAATNILIPGFWKHAAIYVGGGRVIEAVAAGVCESSVETFCADKGHVQSMRAIFATTAEASLAAGFARTLRGTPYDLLFEHAPERTKNKAFYCSEIVWWCYDQVFIAAGKKSPFTPRMTLGLETVAPDDFANAGEKWAVKWRST